MHAAQRSVPSAYAEAYAATIAINRFPPGMQMPPPPPMGMFPSQMMGNPNKIPLGPRQRHQLSTVRVSLPMMSGNLYQRELEQHRHPTHMASRKNKK